MARRPQILLFALILILALLAGGSAGNAAPGAENIFLPLVSREQMVEFRGLWITRYDWAIGHDPTPAAVDQIVANAAAAGFNALLFQVRGTADAYYDSQVEPWAAVLDGSLGSDPGWDPLAAMIAAAHTRGLQVHAYLNVYPVWLNPGHPDLGHVELPPHTVPEHLYHKLAAEEGQEGDKLYGLQWNRDYEVPADLYLRATPASDLMVQQLLDVVADLVSRYAVDGIHLDNVRYGGPANSCDPVTEARIGGPCFGAPPAGYASFEDWQRAQVNHMVSAIYRRLFAPGAAGRPLAAPDLYLSAAVWPFYESGYEDYYQDSRAWLAGGYADALMPMLYGSIDVYHEENNPDPRGRWQELAAGFQAANSGRYVIPGLHGNFDSFSEIEARIAAARRLGTAGHAIFSYGYLAERQYFDDLAAGPYRRPAVVPRPAWRG